MMIAVCFVIGTHPAFALEVDGLSRPESVLSDGSDRSYYISNINGGPLERNKLGYITKVSGDGLTVVQKFIQSREGLFELNAPKGMAIAGKRLFVADIDGVKYFDRDTGDYLGWVDFSPYELKFLNDLAADGERYLYATDMESGMVYRIHLEDKNKVTVFRSGDSIGHPNGIYFDRSSKRLYLVTFDTGELIEIDSKGNLKVLYRGLGAGLDGVTMDDERKLYVSNYQAGVIFRLDPSPEGRREIFQSGLKTPADISFDPRKQIMVPLMEEGRVTSFDTHPEKK